MKSIVLAAVVAAGIAMSGAANASEALAKSSGCMTCHDVATKKMGPSYKDIAAKYKGQDAVATLMQKVRTGGKGSFGPVPMAPTGPEKMGDADLKAAVEFILKS